MFYLLSNESAFAKNIFINFRISLAIPVTSEGRERCRMYAVNYTELLQQGKNVSDPSWPTVPCLHGWEYNYTEVPYASIASEVSCMLISVQ